MSRARGAGRPVVGITVSQGVVCAGEWVEEMDYSPAAYVRAVHRAGARAVLLVPDEDPDWALGLVDAVILSGGAGDVDPDRYGAPRHPQTQPDVPLRDAFEAGLVEGAGARDVPLLGICRGMQLLNVAHGGTLHQHLDDALGHRRLPSGYAEHDVTLEPGSLAALAAGGERASVLSHHHQGVDRVGERLRATGFAGDGGVEAVEAADGRFALGVLWHPEEDERSRVVEALVARARDKA